MKTSLLSNIFKLGSLSFLSRVLGLLRDLVLATYVGPGNRMDAFVIAFTLPNIFRQLFADGTFQRSFVPVYRGTLSGSGPAAAAHLIGRTLSVLLLVTLSLVLIYFSFAERLIPFLGGAGLRPGSEEFLLTVELSKILLAYAAILSISSLFAAVLQAHDRFMAAGLSPVLLNVFALSSVPLAVLFELDVLYLMSLFVLASGLLFLVIVYKNSTRILDSIRTRLPKLDPLLKTLAISILVGAIPAMSQQINMIIGRNYASDFPGLVSYIYLADRIYQLPVGIIGSVVGVVALPSLAAYVARGAPVRARYFLNRALETQLVAIAPAAAVMSVHAEDIIRVLFFYGSFTNDDVASTGNVLEIYALAVPALVFYKLVLSAQFAHGKTRLAILATAVSVAVNLTVNEVGADLLGPLTPPVALTAAAWAFLVILIAAGIKQGVIAPDARLIRNCRLATALVPLLALANLSVGYIFSEISDYSTSRGISLARLLVGIVASIVLTAIFYPKIVPARFRARFRAGQRRPS